jgi:hypothetical protein
MRATTKSSGFSITTVIAVLFVVAVVGLGAFTVFSNDSKDDNKTGSKTSSSGSKDSSNGQKYLVISQWGVKLPLSDAIQDAYYIVSSVSYDANTGGPNTVWISRSSLDDTGCNANEFEEGGNGSPVGTMVRTLPDEVDNATGAKYTDLYPGGVIIGKYYYGYAARNNASCGNAAILQTTNAAFAEAISDLKKTN